MTPLEAAARRLCVAAKLDVLAVQQDGKGVTVTVAAFAVTVETVRSRLTALGVGGVTFAFGDGTGHVRLTLRCEDITG